MTIIVRVEHLQQVGLCVRGARQWFRLHDLDFALFLREGLPIEVIEATGDALALKVAAAAREAHGE